MKKGKLFTIISMLLVLIMILTACGGSNTTDSKDEAGEIKLKMWVHVTDETDEGKVYLKRVQDFNEANKGKIKVDIEFIPRGGGGSGYEDKINTALTTGQLPDIITLDGPNTAAYADAGIIVPIDKYIPKEVKDDYVDSIIQQGTYNGKLYSLGIMESTVALFYNKAIFKELGIKPGTVDNPWTWDDLYNAAKKITKSKGYPALDMALNWTGEWKIYAYAPFVWSNGGDVISADGLHADGIFNSKENVEALSFIQKLVKEGLVSATPEDKSFHIGKSAMLLNGAWTIPDLEKNYKDLDWDVMPYPVSPKTKELHVPTGSWAFAVTSNAKNVEAAAKVVEWMTNKESNIAIHNAIGMLPSRKSAIKEIDDFKKEGPYKVLMDQVLKGGHPRPRSVIYPIISRSFEEAIEAIIYGEDVQKTLTNKMEQIEREAKRYRK
ncbi:extracellular solute-binding protein family 1 [Thermoanaerobacter italicus Ab9]|uniref:Extracellular solute-binding protein family 1 n=1 Tax=Thermoanaerobacter italicus (strain DSM 9252 / Ab9) TaxID=580331 RepID=D3T5G1_THEIA|nr:sugar ABC transporter substrate-binding protein [Thermoanaerobacter italicus]ADD03334.1 extracellular solute-binding protein family 1 [Thermoanaerobacter italicus Ab9]